MNQIILASHGGFAEGARDTLSMVLGDVSNVHVVTLRRDDKEPITAKLEELVESFDAGDDVYVCTDMMGSSVNNSAAEFMKRTDRVTVVSGVNMPLVLALAVSGGHVDETQLTDIVQEARAGLDNFRASIPMMVEVPVKKKMISSNGGKAQIVLARLDYRLLHGQVVFSWVNTVGATRIIVVDNEAASDEIKKGALKLAKPAGVYLNVFTVEKALSKMEKLNTLGEKVMFVFGNVQEMFEFVSAYKIPELNFGAAANHDGANPVGGKDSSVFLDASERATAQKILDLGIAIYEQQTPTQPRTDIYSF